MFSQKYIDNVTNVFNVVVKTDNPVLLVADGLDSGEEISVSVLKENMPNNRPQSFIDDDNNWINVFEDSASVGLTEATNQLFIQAPAWYRLSLTTVPVSAVTVMGFIYN